MTVPTENERRKSSTDAAIREGEPPYRSRPTLEPADQQSAPKSPWLARTLANVLAVGGCFWGVLLSWLWRAETWPFFMAIFGPGYMVTLGYIVRSLSTPPTWGRLLIWTGSLLVQGAWLLSMICFGNSVERQVTTPTTAWWAFATVASVVGLLADLPKKAERFPNDSKSQPNA